MSQHMNLNDRQIISAGLKNGDSLGTIARQIGKCPSTVSREIRGHRVVWDKLRMGGGTTAVSIGTAAIYSNHQN